MKTKETTYIGQAAASVDTVLLSSGKICYLHHKDGMTSLIPDLAHLLTFLDGDTGARLACFPTENADSLVEGFEKMFN